MPNFELLNNVDHKDLRVVTDNAARYGDNVHFVMTFPIEFRRVQACYPIFFQKDANTGKFFPLALLGFEEGENLFLTEDGWDADYVPLMIKRHPFVIGYQQDPNAEGGQRPVMSIDTEHPRVNSTEGEPLFLEHGGTSEFLTSMNAVLDDIQVGHGMSELFVEALVELDLIETVSMEITLDNGAKRQLLGLYTINEDRLDALDSSAIDMLHGRRFLTPLFMIIASMATFRHLIARKNARIAAEAETAN